MKAPVGVGDLVANRYRIEHVIGEGGMGVVVAARHVKLDQRVAIKFLLKEALLRPDLIARFLREGRSATQIRSEHVARVLDADELPTGEPFLVMEYLDGRDLGTLLKTKGPLPVETAVGYALQVCEALAEMHALGIVHRDMKPSNLFLTRRTDGSAVIKVIDFGISKGPARGAEPPDAVLTESAAMLGTLRYMAPEQMGTARETDARADIWALGAVLHALLTGAPPFPNGGMMEVIDSINEGAPALRAALPDAPAALEAVVLRCLKKDREDRYADVAELAAALAEFGPPEGIIAARRAWSILRPVRHPQSEEPTSDVASTGAPAPGDAPTKQEAAQKPGLADVTAASQTSTEAPVVSTPGDRFASINEAADALEPFADAVVALTKTTPAEGPVAVVRIPARPTTIVRTARGTSRVVFGILPALGGLVVMAIAFGAIRGQGGC
jgi:eukaryotic-like serine/threonine-protein kinase